MVRSWHFVFPYEMVTYEMNVSGMSSEGNTARMANTIRPGSYLYSLQDLSFSFRKCAIFHLPNFASR